ncbi:MAG TPA: hypothetical protein VHC68_01550 [Candidatus Paceibacterota bacterium]|nr:hypothetical protein [Candidatus Paceibacterota bacterium]
MRAHPFWNAAGAAAYIGAVVLFINYISSIRANTPDTLLDSMSFISLVVFSAAVMAFLFFYQPVALLIEGKRAEAAAYFGKTLGFFGVIVVLLLALVSLQ